ncbi:FmdB family zinc ribbon protein [Chloroflexota bacterium]
MPIYEYECTCCPYRFELKRSFHDDSPVFCPQCGGATERIFSSVPIIFKGSGFYITDSRGNHDQSPPKSSKNKAKAANTEKKDS